MKKETSILSYSQKRIWFLNKYLDQSLDIIMYNVPYVVQLKGNLNIFVLNKSLNTLIKRQKILRTEIREKNEKVFPKLIKKIDYEIIIENIQNIETDKKKLKKQTLIEEEINYKFNLQHGPLFRTTLIEEENYEFTLIFVFHHIIMDEWSIGIFLKELSFIYTSYIKNSPIRMKRLPLQYTDFSLWERKQQEGNIFKTQLEYWKKQLKGIPNIFNFFTDKLKFNRVSISRFHQFKINHTLYKKMKKLAVNYNATIFMLLLAVFKILLHKYCHQNDIVVSSPIANRHYGKIENVIGCFVNIVMLRTKFRKGLCFAELLEDVKMTTIDAYDNQEMPITKVIEALNPKDNFLDHFFHFFYEFKNLNNYIIDLPDIESRYYNASDFSTLEKKSLQESNVEYPVTLEIEYSQDLYEEESIHVFSKNFINILEQVLNDPNISIEEISIILNDKERQDNSKKNQPDYSNNLYKMNDFKKDLSGGARENFILAADKENIKKSSRTKVDENNTNNLLKNNVINKLNNLFKLTVKG